MNSWRSIATTPIATDKPYLVTELGMFQYGWRWGDPAGPARHDSALLEAEFAVRALDKGADCILAVGVAQPGRPRRLVATGQYRGRQRLARSRIRTTAMRR